MEQRREEQQRGERAAAKREARADGRSSGERGGGSGEGRARERGGGEEAFVAFERNSAGALNCSNSSSAIFSRAAGVLKEGSAIRTGCSAADVHRQLLYACEMSASAASQLVTIPSVSADSTRIPSRRTPRALVPTSRVAPSEEAPSSPPTTPTLDGTTNLGLSSPAKPHLVVDVPMSSTTALTSSAGEGGR